MKPHPAIECVRPQHIQGTDVIEFQCPTCQSYILVSEQRTTLPRCDGTGIDPDPEKSQSRMKKLYESFLSALLLWIVPKLFTFVLVYKPHGTVRAIHLAVHKLDFTASIKDYETRRSDSPIHPGSH